MVRRQGRWAYTFQKLLFKDIGAGFGVKSLFQDAELRKLYASTATSS